MDREEAVAQSLRYAEELSELWAAERAQRRLAQEALADLDAVYGATVRALARVVDLRDDETGSHAERVTALALELARQVDPALAADPELEHGFLLHDIGKIGIRDAILLKPGPLEPAERLQMRRHPTLGVRVVAGVPHLSGVATSVIAHHHERWDGGGYPYGLAGDEIPLAARIFALADAYDSITNDRPYRGARPHEYAVEEILACSGRQFDPGLTGLFVATVARADAA